MSQKFFITVGILAGSIIGSYIPSFWGDNSLFSPTVILFNFAGGIAGIFAGRWVYLNFFE